MDEIEIALVHRVAFWWLFGGDSSEPSERDKRAALRYGRDLFRKAAVNVAKWRFEDGVGDDVEALCERLLNLRPSEYL